MIERQEWVRANHDDLRRVLMLEPRGHPDMCGALLTEPEHPDSDAGVLFMHNQGFAPMSGHGLIAVTTSRSSAASCCREAPGQIRRRAPHGPISFSIPRLVRSTPSSDLADLRSVMVFAGTQINRSPSGTGTCAIMAVLSAMGLLGEGQTFTHESIIGTTFRGRVVRKEIVGEWPAVVAEIEGEAYITAECTFLVDERDPLAPGFRL